MDAPITDAAEIEFEVMRLLLDGPALHVHEIEAAMPSTGRGRIWIAMARLRDRGALTLARSDNGWSASRAVR